jgi:Fis family transcriptional regulator, factor for inversion stimulation protein
MSSRPHLEQTIRQTLEQYFRDLDGEDPHSMHDMIVSAVEKPLLDVVMQRAEGNQSKAAQWLGINRNTLRRKLQEHGLLSA